MIKNIILDFDSTIIGREAFELIIQTVFDKADEKEKARYRKNFEAVAKRVVNGDVLYGKAISEKIKSIKITRRHIELSAQKALEHIDPQIIDAIQFLQSHGKQIFVYSSGPKEIVTPVCLHLGIPADNIFSNKFVYRSDHVIGIDEDNPLFLSFGKVFLSEILKNNNRLTDSTAIVGSSLSDLAVRRNNIADMFVYFGDASVPSEVRSQADFAIEKFEQLLPLICLDAELNGRFPIFAKNTGTEKPKVLEILLLENVHAKAERRFIQGGFRVASFKHAMDEKDVIAHGRTVNALGIRSKTTITAKMIQQMKDLYVIGAFCIGTNQIDMKAAADAGIPVFNAPYSNTRSVAELVVGQTIMLMRRIFEKSSAAHRGKWLKSVSGSTEIRGKTVGIIGYGHIGSQVSVLLESIGMSVLFYDIMDKLPLGNAQPAASLYDLLENSDIVTLHVPDTHETRGMINRNEIRRMKRGSFLINSSRGKVVDLAALKEALDDGYIAGAAVDVFPNEPNHPEDEFRTPLQGIPNVILTPHIGGSTAEAQENIAGYVSYKIEKFLLTGSTLGAVNFPEVDLPRIEGKHRILHIHQNVPGVLTKINSIFSQRHINIEGQMLQTHENIGYLVVDVDQQISEQVVTLLSHITETIQARRIT